jgi:hypothetical protein
MEPVVFEGVYQNTKHNLMSTLFVFAAGYLIEIWPSRYAKERHRQSCQPRELDRLAETARPVINCMTQVHVVCRSSGVLTPSRIHHFEYRTYIEVAQHSPQWRSNSA